MCCKQALLGVKSAKSYNLRYGNTRREFRILSSEPILFAMTMSDSKHRSQPPREHGSTPSSSASHRHAASDSHASSKVNDTASHAKKKSADVTEKDQSGRVTFDSKGNPVWEWQTSPGVFGQDVSTQRLKKLEAPELSLAETQPIPTIGGNAIKKSKSKEDTGFNPYNSDAPVRPRTDRSAAAHPALVYKRPPTKKAEPAKPPGVWDKFKSKFS